MSELREKVIRGSVWNLLERFCAQFVSFFIGMILARLLTPEDYGTVALLTIFTTIASVLVDSGFGTALVQKKTVTEVDFNSVFYLGLTISAILYLVLYCVAPYVADFYKMPVLRPILRVTSLTLILNAINSVQNAELRRKMLFHLSFRISLISTFVGGIVGGALAYLGYGPWALVWSLIMAGVTSVITRWYYIAWRPKWIFSFEALKPLFCFGWKLTLSELINSGFNNLYGLVIGRMYSGADLAYVQKGNHPPSLLMNNINGTLGTVLFPAMSQMQDDVTKMRNAMRRMIVSSTYLLFPLMAICALCAKPAVLVMYGSQWLECVPYMQLACFSFALWPFHTINLQGIQAIGRSDVFLWLEIIKKGLALVVLFIVIPYGVMPYMAATAFVLGPISVLINTWPNRKLLGYSIFMQIQDVMPSAILTALTGTIIFFEGRLIPDNSLPWCLASILLQGISGVVVYFMFSYFSHASPLRECGGIIMPHINRRFPRLAVHMMKWMRQ